MPRKTQTKPRAPSKTKTVAEENPNPVAARTISIVAIVILALFLSWKLGVFTKKAPVRTPEYELLQLEASSLPVTATVEERGTELRALEAQSVQKKAAGAGKTE